MIYKLVTRVIQYFYFPTRPMKGGDILDFQKEGNLRKGEVDLEKGVLPPLPTMLLDLRLTFGFTSYKVISFLVCSTIYKLFMGVVLLVFLING